MHFLEVKSSTLRFCLGGESYNEKMEAKSERKVAYHTMNKNPSSIIMIVETC